MDIVGLHQTILYSNGHLLHSLVLESCNVCVRLFFGLLLEFLGCLVGVMVAITTFISLGKFQIMGRDTH